MPGRPPRGGWQPLPEPTAASLARALVRDLKALERADRDLYPGEWFGLARRLLKIKRYARTGRYPVRPPRGGSAVMRPVPPAMQIIRS